MKNETYISQNEANWRVIRFVATAAFWVAVGAIPSWHFATEHEQLKNLMAQENASVETLSELAPGKIIANAARR